MESKAYLEMLGKQLVHELTAHETIRLFTGNHPTLVGGYAEASVRTFISRMVAPLRVSTGTIITEKNAGKKPPQLDLIVWSPALTPAIFENGDFAIVPAGNAYGYFEIKSTSYSGIGKEIERQLAFETSLMRVPRFENRPNSLGIVCLETRRPDPELRQLINSERAVVLLRWSEGGRVEPNIDGIWTLVNYLTELRRLAARYEANNSALRVKWPIMATPSPSHPSNPRSRR